MFQSKVQKEIKTRILFSKNIFRKTCCLWDNVEKYGGARQATRHKKDAIYMPDN